MSGDSCEPPPATAEEWQRRFESLHLARIAALGMRCSNDQLQRTMEDQRQWRMVLTAALLISCLALRADTSAPVRDGLRDFLVSRGACTRGRTDTTWGSMWSVLCAAQQHAALAAALLGPALWPPGATRAAVEAALAAQLAGPGRGDAVRDTLLERWLALDCTSVQKLQVELELLKGDLYVRGAFGSTTPRYFKPAGVQARAAKAALSAQRAASRLFVASPAAAAPVPPTHEAAPAAGDAQLAPVAEPGGGTGDAAAAAQENSLPGSNGPPGSDGGSPPQPRQPSTEPSSESESEGHERENARGVGRRGRAVRQLHKARCLASAAPPRARSDAHARRLGSSAACC